jgi:hypothetical protein
MQTNDYKTIFIFPGNILYVSDQGIDGVLLAQTLADKAHMPALTNARADAEQEYIRDTNIQAIRFLVVTLSTF